MAVNDEIMGHGADNDGIEEYDNPMPAWWLGLFFVTIVYGIWYGVNYHFLSPTSQIHQYELQMAAAAEQWPQGEVPKTLAFDDATIAAGKVVYEQTCASCHHAELTGGIGPSLVDAEWIHGAEPEQVLTTVLEGVPAKGMPAWGQALGPDKSSKAAAFVLSKFRATGLTPVAAGGGTAEEAPVEAVDPSDPLAAGEAVFKTNCVVCHGADMTGGTGPSLVDTEWIHGGELDQIRKTVAEGVPAKGMIAWGPILGDERVDQVSAYIHAKSQAN